MNEERPKKKFLLKTKVPDTDRHKFASENATTNFKNLSKKFSMMNAIGKMIRSPTNTQSSFQKKGSQGPGFDEISESPSKYDEMTFAEVSGPQLKINKSHLSFIEKTGNLHQDSISVTNNGSTAIYYRWKKLDRQEHFASAIFDKEERFFCHANKNVIKPGEIKTFFFSFKSRCTGIFEEEWTLECEPPLLTPLPVIKLSGHAIADDPNVEWRSEIDMILDAKHKHRFVTEIINDVLDEVRTPTPPLPDLEDPEVCKREFEEKNAKYKLYYTPITMNLYRHLQAIIYEELHMKVEDTYWDLNVDFLTDLINKVRENFVRENLERRWNDLLILAKKKPLDRFPTYHYVKNALETLIKEFPHTLNNTRRERDLMEVQFAEPVELSPEDLKKKQDEEAKAKAEFMKKLKKKPKNEEEEKKMYDDYKAHLTSQISNTIYQQVDILEKHQPELTTLYQLKQKRPEQDYFEMLAMKKTIKDLDMEERRILVRVHIKSKNKIPLRTQEERDQIRAEKEAEKAAKAEAKAKEEQKQQGKGAPKVRAAKKTKEELAEEQARMKEEEEKKEFMDNLDEKSLGEAISVIKTCLEQLAKLVIVLVSFGEANGKPNPETALKYFWEYARNALDQICNFEDTCRIADFQEKVESDAYPPNSAVILENIFHQPEEAGYVFDENKQLVKLDHEQIQEFAGLLSSYAPVYIIEDLYNTFKEYASLTRIKTEFTIFGPTLSNDLTLVAQAFLHCAFQPKKSSRKNKAKLEETAIKKKTIAVVGGEFSPEAIQAINTILGFYDEIYIMGKIGILFIMHKLGLKHFGTYSLDSYQFQLIETILRIALNLGKVIHVPEKLIVAPEPEEKADMLPQWITSIYNTRFVWPDGYEQYKELAAAEAAEKEEEKKKAEQGKKQPPADDKGKKDNKGEKDKKTEQEIPDENTLPPNFLVVGYEQSFIQQIEEQIYNARNILWIGSVEPIFRPGLNDSNQSLALTIYNVKEERKPPILQNAIPADWLVSCVGEDLLEAMNHFDIVFDAPPVQGKKDDAMSEMDNTVRDDVSVSKIDESVSKGTKIEKRNNIGLVADIHSGNTQFVLSLIAGKELEALNIITNYEKKNEDEEEEDFSFIDEI